MATWGRTFGNLTTITTADREIGASSGNMKATSQKLILDKVLRVLEEVGLLGLNAYDVDYEGEVGEEAREYKIQCSDKATAETVKSLCQKFDNVTSLFNLHTTFRSSWDGQSPGTALPTKSRKIRT